MTEEITIGSDINDVIADITPKPVEFEYNGKLWQFKVRSLTWVEKNKLISQSVMRVGGKNGGASFDVNKYNMLYLEKAVVESPFLLNKVNLLQLDEAFGDLLVENLVDSGDNVEAEEAEN